MTIVATKFGFPFPKYIKLLLNGQDISNICYAADDKKGIALCYKTNKQNQFFFTIGFNGKKRVAKEMRKGKVELSLREGTPARVVMLWQGRNQ